MLSKKTGGEMQLPALLKTCCGNQESLISVPCVLSTSLSGFGECFYAYVEDKPVARAD